MGSQSSLLNVIFVQRFSGQVDHLIFIMQKNTTKFVNYVAKLLKGHVIELNMKKVKHAEKNGVLNVNIVGNG